MKMTPTELMKRLKYIEEEIADIHRDDESKSQHLIQLGSSDSVTTLATGYDFKANREKISALHKEERKIRHLLSLFNSQTKVEGYDFTITEGLVRIAELKDEIKVLTLLSRRNEVTPILGYGRERDSYCQKVAYSIEEAKAALKENQRELSALQVAIDKTNLSSTLEVDL